MLSGLLNISCEFLVSFALGCASWVFQSSTLEILEVLVDELTRLPIHTVQISLHHLPFIVIYTA
jgi:uncharacterized protein with PQ loop repeat